MLGAQWTEGRVMGASWRDGRGHSSQGLRRGWAWTVWALTFLSGDLERGQQEVFQFQMVPGERGTLSVRWAGRGVRGTCLAHGTRGRGQCADRSPGEVDMEGTSRPLLGSRFQRRPRLLL